MTHLFLSVTCGHVEVELASNANIPTSLLQHWLSTPTGNLSQLLAVIQVRVWGSNEIYYLSAINSLSRPLCGHQNSKLVHPPLARILHTLRPQASLEAEDWYGSSKDSPNCSTCTMILKTSETPELESAYFIGSYNIDTSLNTPCPWYPTCATNASKSTFGKTTRSSLESKT